MYQVDRAFHAQARLDTLLDEKGQQVAFPGANLFADDKVKAIVPPAPQVAHAQRAFDDIMIGQGNDIQTSVMLNMMKNLLRRCQAIAVGAMHMQVGSTKLACKVGLLLGHLSALAEHGGSCTDSFKVVFHHIVVARSHATAFQKVVM